MSNKLLIIIPGLIPTVEIIVRTLKELSPYYQIKVVLATHLKIKDLISGEYKLLFIRICDPHFKPLIKVLERYQIPFAYYLDDNFWELGKGKHEVLAKYFSNPQLIDTLNLFVSHAQIALAGSEHLKKYMEYFNPNTLAIKAAFDFNLVAGLTQASPQDKVKILYSGSLHREQDFSIVIPALKKILQEYSEKVVLYFNGFVPHELKKFANVVYDEQFYAYADYIKKQFQMAYDIGIAPLHDTPSSRAKSNLKYREYGACHLAGIYSNIPPYSDCVRQGDNGYLVEHHAEDWYQALKELIDNKELRQKIAKNAYQDVSINYTHEKIALEWAHALQKLPLLKTTKTLSLQTLFFIKSEQLIAAIRYKLKRAVDYYQTHGLIYTSGKIMRSLWWTLYYRIIFLKKEKSLLNQLKL